MKLAIVGNRILASSSDAEKAIEDVLDKYNPNEVVSGGAVGIDSMAAKAAKRRGIALKEFLPEKKGWNYYRVRDVKIAKYCDALVRIYSSKSTTYGSGWTADYARRLGKPVEEFRIEE